MDNTIKTSNSIKDYYIRLERMHKNVQNMLNALNQSLISNSSEVTVTVADSDDALTTLRIPSFLYLENKLEELDTNFGNLFNLPKSGDAYFTNSGSSSDIYKMELVRTNTAPASPVLKQTDNNAVGITVNNILKDMVSPKTYIRYNIDNMSDVINSVIMKKYIFYNKDLFNTLQSDYNSTDTTIDTFSDFTDKLFGYKIGTDYDTYESELKLPTKKDTFASKFNIINIKTETDSNNITNTKIIAEVDSIQYTDSENSSAIYYLSVGNKLIFNDPSGSVSDFAEFTIEQINDKDNSTNKELVLTESVGHINFNINTNNVIDDSNISDTVTNIDNNIGYFTIKTENWSQYKYIDIPLEENDMIAFSIAVVYNNIRSVWSKPVIIDLNTIYVNDASGNAITDENGNKLNYIEYYNKYCNNIGDLIQGITDACYPQVSNYTSQVLSDLQNSITVADLVSQSIGNNIKVVPLNKHLTDDATNEEILSLHNQKNEIYSKIQTCQSNIDSVSSKLTNTDFSKDTTGKQTSLQSQLTQYYSEKTLLTKQFNSLVSTLSSKIAQLNSVTDKIKYRLRGITNVEDLANNIYNISNSNKTELIGMEIYYKYKSVNKDTTSVTVINSDTFSEWNIQRPEQRDRYMLFNSDMTDFVIKYVDYDNSANMPQWNQIDIPIKNGEDVIIKIRYIYNIGYPFITLYTPWSEEVEYTFPDEYKEDIQVSTVVDQNNDDTVQASFSQKLINEGYEDHINDKIVNNQTQFFHSPDHIYSGFNTSENNLLSLKEKLQLMVNDINNYKELLDDKIKSKYEVSVELDNNITVLKPEVKNKINIYNTSSTNKSFTKHTINITIKNTSENNVRLYSLFPGNISVPLMYSNINPEYNKKIINYERVPLIVNNKVSPQYLGQWIYFRQNDPYTGADIYLNDDEQNKEDMRCLTGNNKNNVYISEPKFIKKMSDYMNVNNKQVLLPYRFRLTNLANEQETMLLLCSTLSKVKLFFDKYGSNIMSEHNI